jgi:hypothetical protein
MPEPSTVWLALAGALTGVSLERHDESALITGPAALICYLAHRAISKMSRSARADIAHEMRLHGPRRRRKGP